MQLVFLQTEEGVDDRAAALLFETDVARGQLDPVARPVNLRPVFRQLLPTCIGQTNIRPVRARPDDARAAGIPAKRKQIIRRRISRAADVACFPRELSAGVEPKRLAYA